MLIILVSCGRARRSLRTVWQASVANESDQGTVRDTIKKYITTNSGVSTYIAMWTHTHTQTPQTEVLSLPC